MMASSDTGGAYGYCWNKRDYVRRRNAVTRGLMPWLRGELGWSWFGATICAHWRAGCRHGNLRRVGLGDLLICAISMTHTTGTVTLPLPSKLPRTSLPDRCRQSRPSDSGPSSPVPRLRPEVDNRHRRQVPLSRCVTAGDDIVCQHYLARVASPPPFAVASHVFMVDIAAQEMAACTHARHDDSDGHRLLLVATSSALCKAAPSTARESDGDKSRHSASGTFNGREPGDDTVVRSADLAAAAGQATF